MGTVPVIGGQALSPNASQVLRRSRRYFKGQSSCFRNPSGTRGPPSIPYARGHRPREIHRPEQPSSTGRCTAKFLSMASGSAA